MPLDLPTGQPDRGNFSPEGPFFFQVTPAYHVKLISILVVSYLTKQTSMEGTKVSTAKSVPKNFIVVHSFVQHHGFDPHLHI